jgi:hypothetical protein
MSAYAKALAKLERAAKVRNVTPLSTTELTVEEACSLLDRLQWLSRKLDQRDPTNNFGAGDD